MKETIAESMTMATRQPGLVSAFCALVLKAEATAKLRNIDFSNANIHVQVQVCGTKLEQLHRAVMNYDPGKSPQWRGNPMMEIKHIDALHLKPPCNRAGVPQ